MQLFRPVRLEQEGCRYPLDVTEWARMGFRNSLSRRCSVSVHGRAGRGRAIGRGDRNHIIGVEAEAEILAAVVNRSSGVRAC